jgi:hypothetical protein
MFQFSLAELMIVVASVAVASAGIAVPDDGGRGMATLAALMLGFTISGAPLLWWRRRTGVLRDRWGLGELAWFWIGLYLLPLAIGSLVFPIDKADAERWLTVGFAMSAATAASALILGVTKLILRLLGGYQSSGRDWFSRRTTNLIGLSIGALYTGGVGLRLAWQNGWLDWLTTAP